MVGRVCDFLVVNIIIVNLVLLLIVASLFLISNANFSERLIHYNLSVICFYPPDNRIVYLLEERSYDLTALAALFRF